jgi:hypothetical protein
MGFKKFIENWFNDDFQFQEMNAFQLMKHFKLDSEHGWSPEWIKYWLSYPDKNNPPPGPINYKNKKTYQSIIVQNPHDEEDTYVLVSNNKYHMTNLNKDKIGYYFVRDDFNKTKNANFDLINISFPNEIEALKYAIDNYYFVQK